MAARRSSTQTRRSRQKGPQPSPTLDMARRMIDQGFDPATVNQLLLLELVSLLRQLVDTVDRCERRISDLENR